MARLYGPTAGAAKLAEIDASLAEDHHRPRLSDLIDGATGRVRRLVWVGIGLATFQQLVGINVVFYYGAVLWQSVGFSESDALLINVISGAVSILACLVTISLIDKVGRKPLLWVGSVGMALTLGIMSAAFASATLDADGALQMTDGMGAAALLAANFYVFFFNASWGAGHVGDAGGDVSQSDARFRASRERSVPMGLQLRHHHDLSAAAGRHRAGGAYSFYAAAAVASVFFVVKWVHETRGLELEEMPG